MIFEEVYKSYYPRLYGFAYQYTLSKQDSEDFVDETFTRFWRELKQGSEITNTQAWLYKVLINLIRTSKDREKKGIFIRNQIAISQIDREDIESKYFLDEKRRIIIRELNQLTDAEKNLLILYNRGLKYEEIAEILEIKSSSVGTMIARALIRFKEVLKTKYDGLFE
jgi:RNA polymerase sigma-70 factor (ECF subfamily)